MNKTQRDERTDIRLSLDKPEQEEESTIRDEALPLETYHVYPVAGGMLILQEELQESPAPVTPPKPDYIAYLFIFLSLLAILFPLLVSVYQFFHPPIATVIIIPNERTITTTSSIRLVPGTPQQGELHERQLSAITMSQSETVKATGIEHQQARHAQGFLTFYNGQFITQTIKEGTVLTGSDGIAVVTDQTVAIPGGNPPTYGATNVPAHALIVGSAGNIQENDINEVCCAASVLAKNTNGFSGGSDARTFTVVTTSDIQSAELPLKTSLSQSMQAALKAQAKPDETLISLPCNPTMTADHHAGEEATNVQGTIAETCTGITINTQALQFLARSVLTQQATQQIDSHYQLLRFVQPVIRQLTTQKTSLMLTIESSGTWVYSIHPEEKERIKHTIAGKTKQEALHLLAGFQGIQRVLINISPDTTRLPKDASTIHFITLISFHD